MSIWDEAELVEEVPQQKNIWNEAELVPETNQNAGMVTPTAQTRNNTPQTFDTSLQDDNNNIKLTGSVKTYNYDDLHRKQASTL